LYICDVQFYALLLELRPMGAETRLYIDTDILNLGGPILIPFYDMSEEVSGRASDIEDGGVILDEIVGHADAVGKKVSVPSDALLDVLVESLGQTSER